MTTAKAKPAGAATGSEDIFEQLEVSLNRNVEHVLFLMHNPNVDIFEKSVRNSEKYRYSIEPLGDRILHIRKASSKDHNSPFFVSVEFLHKEMLSFRRY